MITEFAGDGLVPVNRFRLNKFQLSQTQTARLDPVSEAGCEEDDLWKNKVPEGGIRV